jgi:hypothetical protein
MGWKELKFRVVRQMGIGACNEQYAAFRRSVYETLNVRYDFFSAWDVQLPARQCEIHLGVDFPKNHSIQRHLLREPCRLMHYLSPSG